mmetsp:Transcript_24276/g.35973  ORF Transcript_24276/g.35973 Transcript_24276/m.35973 type:complete len:268 (+) Transcript_24276:414-1217(+)
MFGACIKRVVNWAVGARKKYPKRRTLAIKVDYRLAYRRDHLNAEMAIQTCTQLPEENLAIISLRLTFGGSPGPYEWGVLSEFICKLVNEILQNERWDQEKLFAPNSSLVPKKKTLDDDVPSEEGRDLIVDVPIEPKGFVDIYIGDMIELTVDLKKNNDTRLERSILLAIHVAARPMQNGEPILREEMAAISKLTAEAGLEEMKMILGWLVNFRSLQISLPDNKFVLWTESITENLRKMKSTAKELEQNIGRLVHLGMTIPAIHDLLS